ncbi:MAG TPA: cytochrome c biogenesis protein CcsA [Gammaproteobacteria bacterium]|nr:cytochrome c biogenesis protein CcsA [Gammaproteobacteria bacterium]
MPQGTRKKSKGIFGAITLVMIVAGLYWGLIKAPPDAFQGDSQRIMYLHIPSILVAYLSFFLVFVASCLYLWKRERRYEPGCHPAALFSIGRDS